MNDSQLQSLVRELIATRREGVYWDFKQKHHENKADLLHDILCLSNAIWDGNRYLIFGVADSSAGCEVLGLVGTEPRRTQADLVDFLRSKTFAGEIVPQISLRTLNFDGYELDILAIKNRPEKPYYITKDYPHQSRKVKAHSIYCREEDSNTPIDRSASRAQQKVMWAEALGYGEPLQIELLQSVLFEVVSGGIFNAYRLCIKLTNKSDRPVVVESVTIGYGEDERLGGAFHGSDGRIPFLSPAGYSSEALRRFEKEAMFPRSLAHGESLYAYIYPGEDLEKAILKHKSNGYGRIDVKTSLAKYSKQISYRDMNQRVFECALQNKQIKRPTKSELEDLARDGDRISVDELLTPMSLKTSIVLFCLYVHYHAGGSLENLKFTANMTNHDVDDLEFDLAVIELIDKKVIRVYRASGNMMFQPTDESSEWLATLNTRWSNFSSAGSASK